jgi:hypothetical protein
MSIPHTVGAQQGNKMAPILLLFVTQAISESLKDKWEKEWGLTCPRSHIMLIPSIKKDHGTWLPADKKHDPKGNFFEIPHLLRVNDITFFLTAERPLLKKG